MSIQLVGNQGSYRNTRTNLSSPPWEMRSLKHYCERLNRNVGSRTQSYVRLLEILKNSLEDRMDEKVFLTLVENFFLVLSQMPQKIRLKEEICVLSSGIKDQIKKLSHHFPNAFINILDSMRLSLPTMPENDLKAQTAFFSLMTTSLMSHSLLNSFNIKRALAQTRSCFQPRLTPHVPILKNQILHATDRHDVNLLKEELRHVQDALPEESNPLLKQEVEKTLDLASRKYFLRYFDESHTDSVTRQRTIFPVLSIDGGGIRGILPAKVLIAIENMTRQPISKLFKLIGGTSTGGILALGLVKPISISEQTPHYSAADLLDIYTSQHQEIFRANPRYLPDKSHLPLGEKIHQTLHNPKYLTPELFDQRFEEASLSHALTDVVITANNLHSVLEKGSQIIASTGSFFVSLVSSLFSKNPTSIIDYSACDKTVHLFTKSGLKHFAYNKNTLREASFETRRHHSLPQNLRLDGERVNLWSVDRSNYSMSYVAKVTSAAPSFFPPVNHDHSELFFDGGVLQNDPSIPLVFEAEALGARKKDIFLVSLGTGEESQSRRRSAPDFDHLSLWFEATQPKNESFDLMSLLSAGAYNRVQYEFEGKAPGLDETNRETIAYLEECADAHVEDTSDELREICKVIYPEMT